MTFVIQPWCIFSRYSLRSARKWGCKVVGSHHCAHGDPGLCWGSSAFPIVDLAFHGQWYISQVQHQPSWTCTLACLESHPSLVNRMGGTFQVAMSGCQDYSLKLAAQDLQPCEICHSTIVHFVSIYSLRTARKWDCTIVGSHHCVHSDSGLCWGNLAFPIVDLT